MGPFKLKYVLLDKETTYIVAMMYIFVNLINNSTFYNFIINLVGQ